MAVDTALEALMTRIAEMDRQQCIEQLLHFPAVPLDFDRPTLQAMSTDRLRHLLMAAVYTHGKYHGSQPAAV